MSLIDFFCVLGKMIGYGPSWFIQSDSLSLDDEGGGMFGVPFERGGDSETSWALATLVCGAGFEA